MEIIQAEATHAPAIGRTLAQAFNHDPLCCYIFPDEERRLRHLQWVFTRWSFSFIKNGSAYAPPDISGAALWRTPKIPLAAWVFDQIRAGLLLTPFRLSSGELRRGVRVYADAAAHFHRNVKKPHWILDTLGIAPEHQGRGMARLLLTPVLAQADAMHGSCYLITNSEKNISLYEHFGFHVADRYLLKGTSLMMCGMRRPPASNAGT